MTPSSPRVYGALLPDQVVVTTSHLALFLGGSEDSFTGHLVYLIAKGHPQHDGRVARGYPGPVRAYQVWMAASSQPTAKQLYEAIERDCNIRRMGEIGYIPADKWEVPDGGNEHDGNRETGR